RGRGPGGRRLLGVGRASLPRAVGSVRGDSAVGHRLVANLRLAGGARRLLAGCARAGDPDSRPPRGGVAPARLAPGSAPSRRPSDPARPPAPPPPPPPGAAPPRPPARLGGEELPGPPPGAPSRRAPPTPDLTPSPAPPFYEPAAGPAAWGGGGLPPLSPPPASPRPSGRCSSSMNSRSRRTATSAE